jgi:hypothetical protein
MTPMMKMQNVFAKMGGAINNHFDVSGGKAPTFGPSNVRNMTEGKTIWHIVNQSQYEHDEMCMDIIKGFDGMVFEHKKMIHDFLRSSSVHMKSLSKEIITDMSRRLKAARFRIGEVIKNRGDDISKFFFVCSGHLTLFD